ncbi:MAG: endonuclease/exonuclease/phosphatase family protein [Sphingobium sp.]
MSDAINIPLTPRTQAQVDARAAEFQNYAESRIAAPEVRAAFARLIDQGWTDALRTVHPDKTIYTFWDYFRNAFGRNAGLRLDHLLLSPALATRLRHAQVDTHVRGWEKSSDHAPVWIALDDAPRRKRPHSRPANQSA